MGNSEDIQNAIRILEKHDDYRVLSRISSSSTWNFPGPEGQTRRGLFVDVETTGLNTETDEIIEVALLPFDYDPSTGDIVAVHENEALNELRDPGIPIPSESSQIHGITEDQVRGKVVDEERINSIVDRADLIIAHNAAFDRPMLERVWPCFTVKPWACSLVDVDWRAEGFGAGKLDYLLMQQGWFYDGHRALSDCLAGVFLLSRSLPKSGALGMFALLQRARVQRFSIRAVGAPFESKDELRKRGYSWDPGSEAREKAWWTIVENTDVELEWLAQNIYHRETQLPAKPLTAIDRFSTRVN